MPDHYLMLKQVEEREGDPHQGGFGCHKDRRKPYAERESCVGWLLDQKRKGMPAIALRILLMRNPPAQAQYDECYVEDDDIYNSIDEMLEANLAAERLKHPERYS